MLDGAFVAMVLRLGVSLAVVVLLMAGCGRLLARHASRAGAGTAALRLVGRHSLGRKASVVVVTVAGRGLVLGVSEDSVRLLAEVDAQELAAAPEPPPAAIRALPFGRPALAGAVRSPAGLLELLRTTTTRRPRP